MIKINFGLTKSYLKQEEIDELFIRAVSIDDFESAKNYLNGEEYRIKAKINCREGRAFICAAINDNNAMMDYFFNSQELSENIKVDENLFKRTFQMAMGHGCMEVMDYLVSQSFGDKVNTFFAANHEEFMTKVYRSSIQHNRVDKMIRFLTAKDLRFTADAREGQDWGIKYVVDKGRWDMAEHLMLNYDIDVNTLKQMTNEKEFRKSLKFGEYGKLIEYQNIRQEKALLEQIDKPDENIQANTAKNHKI